MAKESLLLCLIAHGSHAQSMVLRIFFPKMDRWSFSLQSLRNTAQGSDSSLCSCKYHTVVYLSGRVYVICLHLPWLPTM